MLVKGLVRDVTSTPTQDNQVRVAVVFECTEPLEIITARIDANLMTSYQNIKGKEGLIPVTINVFNGRAYYNVSALPVAQK